MNNFEELLQEAEIVREIKLHVLRKLVHLFALDIEVVVEVGNLFSFLVGVGGGHPTDLHVVNSGEVCFAQPFHDLAFLVDHLDAFEFSFFMPKDHGFPVVVGLIFVEGF